MIKLFCDICGEEITWNTNQTRRIAGCFKDTEIWFSIQPTAHCDGVDCCEPCFNEAFEDAFRKHIEAITVLRAQKAKGYAVPDV